MSWESVPACRRQTPIEPLAPVNGGIRWRRPFSGLVDYVIDPDDDMASRDGSPETEKTAAAEPDPVPVPPPAPGPQMVFTPPPEARVGEEYIVRAKAFDPCISGFTWFFKNGHCPPGMTLDRYTGEIRWTPTEGGRFEVTLGCSTVHGRSVTLTWTICVRKAAVVRVAIAHPRFHNAMRRKATRALRRVFIFWRLARRPAESASRAAAPPGPSRAVAYALRL